MKKTWNYLTDYWFYYFPMLRRYQQPKPKIFIARYPTPGSVLRQNQFQDYKTPMSNSSYNVRYIRPIYQQVSDFQSKTLICGRNFNSTKKLILLKYLNENDKNNPTAINQAKTKFKSDYGFPVQNQYYQNDFQIKLPSNNDRQTIKKLVIQSTILNSQIIQTAYRHQQQGYDKNPNWCQQTIQFLPHDQQYCIQSQYKIQKIISQQQQIIAREGGIPVKFGSANYWKPLDDHNSPQNMKKIAQKIQDSNPLDYRLPNAKIIYHYDKEGNVQHLQTIKNQQNN